MRVVALWISRSEKQQPRDDLDLSNCLVLLGGRAADRSGSEETLLVLLVVGTDVEAALSLGTSSSLLEQ